MSRSTNQSLVLLAVAHGGVISIRTNFNFGERFETLLQEASQALAHALTQWPGTGAEARNQKWVIARIAEWEGPLARIPAPWTILALIMVGHQSLRDLSERLRDPLKIDLLAPAIAALSALDDELDATGKNVESQAHVGVLLSELYKIIDFEV